MTGLTKATALDGRAYDIACGQIDIGNAETEMAARTRTASSRRMGRSPRSRSSTSPTSFGAVLYMASLPLEANVPFLTVMATKMPYLGRG